MTAGVDAGKLLRTAGFVTASEHMAAVDRLGRRAAPAAEPVGLAPVDHGPRVGQQTGLLGRQRAGEHAQVLKVHRRVGQLRAFARQADSKNRVPAKLAQQHVVGRVDRWRAPARRSRSRRSAVRPAEARRCAFARRARTASADRTAPPARTPRPCEGARHVPGRARRVCLASAWHAGSLSVAHYSA